MVVQAYILIQTDVGKAAEVAKAIAQVKGVTLAEDVTGPYDVIVRAEATQRRRARQARRVEGADPRRHHAHADVPGRPHLSDRRTCTYDDASARRGRGVVVSAAVCLLVLAPLAACSSGP